MIDALQGGGGMLLVPTDDSLLNATALLSGGFNDTAALRVFLARHTILTQNQLVCVVTGWPEQQARGLHGQRAAGPARDALMPGFCPGTCCTRAQASQPN